MAKRKCPVIGLVGGMGSGKSSIAGIFKRMGAVIIDADATAHQVLQWPDIKARIVEVFGQEVLSGGEISRRALGEKVFDDEALVHKLNSIVHPAVIDESKKIIEASRRDSGCRAVVLDAPLLLEAGLEGLCDCLVFVDAGEAVRAERLAAARGWDAKETSRREKFQDSLISKRIRADYTVDNNGSLDEAARQVAAVWASVVDEQTHLTHKKPH